MGALLGFDLEALSAAERWHVEFLRGSGAALPIAALALLAAYAVILYRLRPGDASGRSLVALFVLRSIVFAGLLVMLMQPALVLESAVPSRRRIAVVIDNSTSMGVKDARGDSRYARQIRRALPTQLKAKPEEASRLDVAKALASGAPGSLKTHLATKLDVALYAVSDKIDGVDSPELLKPTGRTSRLGDGLVSLLERDVESRLGGIVLLSDGRSNAGASLEAAARRLERASIPVWCVGVGRPGAIPDVEVFELVAPAVIADGSTGELKFTVRRSSPAGPDTVTVKLEQNGRAVDEKTVAFEGKSLTASDSFEISSPQDSQDVYKVHVVPRPDELNTENNSRTAVVRLDTGKKKVLYIDGRARWQFRYLKNALLRDENFEAACVLLTSPVEATFEGSLKQFDKLPEDPKKLAELDAVILGDVDPSYFSSRQLQAIKDFVDKDAGGLVLAAGKDFMPASYRNTPLESLVPLDMDAPGSWVTGATALKPIENHPLVLLAEKEKDNQKVWRELPKTWTVYAAKELKSGARTLLVDEKKRPVVVFQPYGLGRSVLVATDGTWRWRYRVQTESADKYFWRFWRQTLLFAAGAKAVESRGVSLNTDKKRYDLGERPKVTLQLRDEQSQPIVLSEVKASLRNAAGDFSMELTMKPLLGRPGFYRAEAPALEEGKYEITARPQGARSPGKVSFEIESPKGEFADINLNRKGLETLGSLTGGGYFSLSEIDRLVSAVTATGKASQMKTVVVKLWHSPLLFAIIILAISAEWILRKIVRLI